MTKGDLAGVLVWGRPVKPVALGATWLMATIVGYNLFNQGLFGHLVIGDLVAVLAGSSYVLLMAGWFGRSQWAAEVGLLLACVVYILRGSFAALYVSPRNEGVWLSLGAAIILGGAYLLEHWDEHKENQWTQ